MIDWYREVLLQQEAGVIFIFAFARSNNEKNDMWQAHVQVQVQAIAPAR